MKNSCSGVDDTQAMHAFVNGLKPDLVPFMIRSKTHKDLGSMLRTANEHAAAEDDIRARGGNIAAYIQTKKTPRTEKKATQDAQDKPKEVNLAFGRERSNKWKGKGADNKEPVSYSK